MTKKHTTASSCRPPPSPGFSLLEVMVALGLAGILLLGLAEIFASNVKNATATSNLSSIQDNGRIAVQLLSADIRRAGFLGGNIRIREITGTLGESDAAATCVANTPEWARRLGQSIFGLNNADTGYECISGIADDDPGTYLRGDILTLRYTEALPVDPNEMTLADNANRLYLRATVVEGRLFVGSTQGNAENDIVHEAAEGYALAGHAYYVGDSQRECQDAAIPSLYRVSVGANGLPVSQELLPGVEHLQFRYQINNRYLDADDIVLADWSAVTAVEISVLVRAQCPETAFVSKRRFIMGDLLGKDAYPPANTDDGYRRQLYQSVVALRNFR